MSLGAEALIQHLGLQGSKQQLAILGVGGKTQNLETTVTVARISHVNGSVQKNVVLRSMPDPTGGLEVPQWHKYAKLWPHLKNLPFLETPKGLKVELILGNDQGYFHRSLQEYYHPSDIEAPVARLTPLGLTVTGRMQPKSQDVQARVNMHQVANIFKVAAATDSEESCQFQRLCNTSHLRRELEKDIKPPTTATKSTMWTPPQPGDPWVQVKKIASPLPGDKAQERPPVVNPGDKQALYMFQQKTIVSEDNKAKAPVLWKNDTRPPNNYFQALKVWKSLKQKLVTQPKQYAAYDQSFQKWISSGYVKVLRDVDPKQKDSYYLTHFPVVREDKETTKVRVVMNGKASFGGNPSLNDCILKGPKLLNDLPRDHSKP